MKRLAISIFFAISIISLIGIVAAQCTGPYVYQGQFSPTCSSEHPGLPCERISDGIYSGEGPQVYWTSQDPSGQDLSEWAYVDLGETKCINNLKVYQYGSTQTADIQVSDDAQNWFTHYDEIPIIYNPAENNGEYTENTYSLVTEARYVRVLFDDRASDCTPNAICHISELEVEVETTGSPPPTESDQTLFILNSTKNSHVWQHNDTENSITIEYNEFFAGQYSGANPHECNTGNNPLFYLFYPGNSHVSITEQAGTYEIPVCYGDLDCRIANSSKGESCSVNEAHIASLYQASNSHVSRGEDVNYAYKVCCSSESYPVIGQCEDDERIMRLSTQTNAHGALWNDSFYTEAICHTDFLGEPTGSGPSLHDCLPGNENVLLWLAGNTNAHAAIAQDSVYNVPICYGNLECRAINATAGESCASNEAIVASLSSNTNAHVSRGNDPNYPHKICCISGPSLDIASWKNMRDQITSTADLNDLVKLTVGGGNLAGITLNFTIFKKDGGLFFFDEEVESQTSTSGFTKWRAGQGTENLESGEYYFEVQIPGVGTKSTLDNADPNFKYLTVSDTEVNSPPVANILTPQDKGIYFKDEILSFTQNSYDEDDEFTFTWQLEPGVTLQGNSSNLSAFNSSYQAVGQKTIFLTLVDDRSLSSLDSKDTSTISIIDVSVDDKFILAYIDKPEFGTTLGRIVEVNASSTYSIETLSGSISCAGGLCPSQTTGCPVPGSGGNCQLNISNAPSSPSQANYNDIEFSWIFKKGNTQVSNKTAFGNQGVAFSHNLPQTGLYRIELTTSINPSSTTETEIEVLFAPPVCLPINTEDDKLIVPGSSIGESYWVSDSFVLDSSTSCYDPSGGVDINGDPITTCCPLGYSCNTETSECEFELVTKCSDLITEQECIDKKDTAIIELDGIIDQNFPGGCSDYSELYGDSCFSYIECECQWDSGNDTCQAVSNHKVQSVDNSQTWKFPDEEPDAMAFCSSSEEAPVGRCVFDFTDQGNCEENEFIIRSWTANYETSAASANDPDYCTSGEEIVSCGTILKLPFFNITNVVIAVLILVIIYYLITKNKTTNKKSKKKNKK